jgi:hypothetical protein
MQADDYILHLPVLFTNFNAANCRINFQSSIITMEQHLRPDHLFYTIIIVIIAVLVFMRWNKRRDERRRRQ